MIEKKNIGEYIKKKRIQFTFNYFIKNIKKKVLSIIQRIYILCYYIIHIFLIMNFIKK